MVEVFDTSYSSLRDACATLGADFTRVRSLIAMGNPLDNIIKIETNPKYTTPGRIKKFGKEYPCLAAACQELGIATSAVTKLRYNELLTEQEALDTWVDRYWSEFGYQSLTEAIQNTDFKGIKAENLADLAAQTGIAKDKLKRALQFTHPSKWADEINRIQLAEEAAKPRLKQSALDKLHEMGVSDWVIDNALKIEFNFVIYNKNLVLLENIAKQYGVTVKEFCTYLKLDIQSILRRIQYNLPADSVKRMIMRSGTPVSNRDADTLPELLGKLHISFIDYINIASGKASDELVSKIATTPDRCTAFSTASKQVKDRIKKAYLASIDGTDDVADNVAEKIKEIVDSPVSATVDKKDSNSPTKKATATSKKATVKAEASVAKRTTKANKRGTTDKKVAKYIHKYTDAKQSRTARAINAVSHPDILNTGVKTEYKSDSREINYRSDPDTIKRIQEQADRESDTKRKELKDKQSKFLKQFDSKEFKVFIRPGVFGTYVLARLSCGAVREPKVLLYNAAMSLAHTVSYDTFLQQLQKDPNQFRNIPSSIKVNNSDITELQAFLSIFPLRNINSVNKLSDIPAFNPITLVGMHGTQFDVADTTGVKRSIEANELEAYIKIVGVTNAIITPDGIRFIGGTNG